MSYRLWCEELLFQQDSEGWVITVIHDPAIPAYTTFHIALQWNQISPSIFSDNISAWGCLSFNPLSRGPSTEVLELEGNVSAVLSSTSLQDKHVYPYQMQTRPYRRVSPMMAMSPLYSKDSTCVPCWVWVLSYAITEACMHKGMHKLHFSCSNQGTAFTTSYWKVKINAGNS